MSADKIPLIDFSDFYSPDPATKKNVVEQIRESCLYNGFFQISKHTVPLEQQKAVMDSAKRLFSLDLEEKQKVAKENNTWNRGYEMLRSQILEEGTQPELKEGFYIGDDISTDHPYFVNKKLNSGPNQWPQILGEEFKKSSMEYYKSTLSLAADLLKALALSLDLEENYFAQFMDGAVATMRLLHYPSQPPDADEKLTRGIGAHTDFGAITLLLQDEVDGLQVWDKHSNTWIDVEPTKGALVVNLGNLMSRWTNEKYKSNVHRVINKSGKERYSIPLFVSGNPDYLVECIPTCKAPGDPAKFPPVTVQDAVSAAYAESYGRAQLYKQGLEKAVDCSPATITPVAGNSAPIAAA
ncbi:Sexual differentiation process protein isp7 [Cytospora mali]|uniref:Sexual differentiation process protein isp7 n=1 Tax=Cytospora mali TaxID=578113 RepID=A0A194V7L8_CYTMA|nr:Sexual differentiation process protein isp7 [Valsa mali var. pyri (nom. inval.)]